MVLAWDAVKQKPARDRLYKVNCTRLTMLTAQSLLMLTATHTCLESGATNLKPGTYSSIIQAYTFQVLREAVFVFLH